MVGPCCILGCPNGGDVVTPLKLPGRGGLCHDCDGWRKHTIAVGLYPPGRNPAQDLLFDIEYSDIRQELVECATCHTVETHEHGDGHEEAMLFLCSGVKANHFPCDFACHLNRTRCVVVMYQHVVMNGDYRLARMADDVAGQWANLDLYCARHLPLAFRPAAIAARQGEQGRATAALYTDVATFAAH